RRGLAAWLVQPVAKDLQGWAGGPPDGHEVVLGDEEVHFSEGLTVSGDAVADQVDHRAEVLHLRSLAELGGVLDRQRMQLKDVAQQRQAVITWRVQVKPEQCAVAE